MGDHRGLAETSRVPEEAQSPQPHGFTQTARYEPITALTNETDALRRRLNTYSQWNSKKSSLQLATAGFIYTGVTDKVECQSCGIRLYNWQEDEDPLQAHKKYAPDCEFMLKNYPNVKTPTQPKKILTVKYPHYSDYETRLRSFDSWPLKCVAQKPDIMAKSGFFYIGSADRARCFYCGITLRDWDTDDYPPCVHRQWSENCPYVQNLDVGALEAEIKKMESIYARYNTRGNFDNPAVLLNATSVPNGNSERSLREPNFPDLPRSPRLTRHRMTISRGEIIEVELRGDENEERIILVIKRDDNILMEE